MSATRLQHLDGLRGIACLLVVYQHLSEYAARLPGASALAAANLHFTFHTLELGKLGVVLFFAISGFIIPFSFERPTSPRLGFAVSRIFRLYPAYWVSVLAAAALLPALTDASIAPRQWLANLTMLQALVGEKDVLGVYWTLLIEIVFYVLCFGLFTVGRLRCARTLFALFCALLVLAFAGALLRSRGIGGVPVALPLYLAVMWFATCLRLHLVDGDAAARRLHGPMLAMLLVAVPVVWATGYDDDTHKASVQADVSGFCAALLLFVLAASRARRWPTVLAALGTISYPVYLFHGIALELADRAARAWAAPFDALVLVLLTLALTLALSQLVHVAVERPGMRLGKRLLPPLERLLRDGRRLLIGRA